MTLPFYHDVMVIFLDTSSLFKLYHLEADSEEIELIFTQNAVQTVFLSEITKLEFASTVWKKVRMTDLTKEQGDLLLQAFQFDFPNYSFVQLDSALVEKAMELLSVYGKAGLRTLDSLQLATAILIKDQLQLAKTADKLLFGFFEAEELPT